MSNARFGLRVRSGFVRGITEGVQALDADALAFLNATGITDPIQYGAINQLVVDLKTYGLWTKMKAIYPFVGGTASTHKFNLKDPRDLDAAFRLVFNGGWAHSITGVTPNGTNAFADTYFTPSSGLIISSAHLTFYSRGIGIGANSGGYPVDMGCDISPSGSNGFNLSQKMTGAGATNYHGRAFIQTLDGVDSNNIAGFHIVNRQSITSLKYYRNNALIQTNTTTEIGQLPNFNVYIGAVNNFGTAGLYSNRECAFASIGDGLTDTEAANLYTAVQAFQTTLSRQI